MVKYTQKKATHLTIAIALSKSMQESIFKEFSNLFVKPQGDPLSLY